MIIGDAIAVGKRPTERCQTFKVQAVSLNREIIRKKGEKGEEKKKRQQEKKKAKKKRPTKRCQTCKVQAVCSDREPRSKPDLKRGKPELKGENRIFKEERGGEVAWEWSSLEER